MAFGGPDKAEVLANIGTVPALPELVVDPTPNNGYTGGRPAKADASHFDVTPVPVTVPAKKPSRLGFSQGAGGKL